MTKDILDKLRAQLEHGIESEMQVVYLLVGIRKIIERDGQEEEYQFLKFHCDWVVHPRLNRNRIARHILKRFDQFHPLLCGHVAFENLPCGLNNEISDISGMQHFREELERFLERRELPPLTARRYDGWAWLLREYSHVVHDIPLVVAAEGDTEYISSIVVQCEEAKLPDEQIVVHGKEITLFRVRWIISDKNGQSGTYETYNTVEREVPPDEGLVVAARP